MKSVYFDHAATTPVDRRVLERMLPFFCDVYGNPSELHKQGREARAAVDRARVQVATAIGAGDKEIVFTAGGTESDNLALFGYLQRFEPGHFIIGATEHPAVMEAARALGWPRSTINARRGALMNRGIVVAKGTKTGEAGVKNVIWGLA